MDLSKSNFIPENPLDSLEATQNSQEAILNDIRTHCEQDKAIELFKELIFAFHDEINVLLDKITDKDVILDFYQDEAVSLSCGMQLLVDYLQKRHGPDTIDLDGSKALKVLMKGISDI